jgi:PAS domain S-box-containing protein/diguanylate cyclase (GGDEF)-like protein
MVEEHVDYATEHARDLLDEFIDLIQVVSADGTFLYANQAWHTRLGYTDADIVGMTFLDIIHPEHQQPWKAVFRSVLGGERLDHFEMVLIAKNGTPVSVDGSVWARKENDQAVSICAVFHDAGARVVGEQRMSRVLYKDELSGLFNRRGFGVRCAPLLELLEENRDRLNGWLIWFDIDNLDSIERKAGEAAANEAIKRAADVIRRGLRIHDIVGRLTRGGFAALVSLPPKYQPSYVTTRVRAGLQLANRHHDPTQHIELAMGAAEVVPGRSLDDAVARAAAQAAATSSHRRKAPAA